MYLRTAVSELVNEENLWAASFPCGGRTWIWGIRPPDPPLRSGTPPLKLALQMDGWCAPECGIRSILDFSWELLDLAEGSRLRERIVLYPFTIHHPPFTIYHPPDITL